MRLTAAMLARAGLVCWVLTAGCQSGTGSAAAPAPVPPNSGPATGPVDAAAAHRDSLRRTARAGAGESRVDESDEEGEPTEAARVSPMLGARVVTRAGPGGAIVERAPAARSARPPAAAMASPGATHRIVLKKTFIEHVKDRATITTEFTPIASIKHSVAQDADEHISGLAEEPVMTMVAEMMNCAEADEARSRVDEAIANAASVQVTGVWRLWCEHPGTMDHIQDAEVPDYSTFEHLTNPDHVYEMHPVTKFDGVSLLDTLHPIGAAYTKRKTAAKGFGDYEALTCSLSADAKTVTIRTKTVGDNYTEFWLRLEESPTLIADGQIVLATPLDSSGDAVTDGARRMVFVKNSPPEKAVRNQQPGDVMHVLGMPRVDLGVIAERVETGHLGTHQPLPYEIVVVGVYPH